eukprot:7353045-Lingulodinium_polyedra.AAC.1
MRAHSLQQLQNARALFWRANTFARAYDCDHCAVSRAPSLDMRAARAITAILALRRAFSHSMHERA